MAWIEIGGAGSATTPHVAVFDRERRLRYKGRIDDARDRAVTKRYLQDDVAMPETEPAGCAFVGEGPRDGRGNRTGRERGDSRGVEPGF